MAERFYSEVPVAVGQVVSLDELQSHHLLHVMRASVGTQVQVFDGGPDAYLAQIVGKDRRTVRVEVLEVVPVAASLATPRVLVAAPVPKGDRFRFLVEKLTEMGADAYQPLLTHRSVNALTPSLVKKAEQWGIEACKQAGRNRLLQILPAAGLDEVLAAVRAVPQRWVACTPSDLPVVKAAGTEVVCGAGEARECGSGASAVRAVGQAAAGLSYDVAVVVGPEGGLTPEELERLASEGWRPVQVGPHVLRIETAAVAVLAGILTGARLGGAPGTLG
jgi:16S rRNA (uracil1498-N3)-methyltransferase